jgi:hypothetical protein
VSKTLSGVEGMTDDWFLLRLCGSDLWLHAVLCHLGLGTAPPPGFHIQKGSKGLKCDKKLVVETVKTVQIVKDVDRYPLFVNREKNLLTQRSQGPQREIRSQ